MGRIAKEPAEHHKATLSPFVSEFIERATKAPLHGLPALLDGFRQHWPMPRGDLYHWIPLLNRLDHVLELFNKEYGLDSGPQTQPFQRKLLERGDAEEDMPYPATGARPEELDTLGYSAEGDRELVETLLRFTRILLEHCGNRSIYASGTHVDHLLHTTSLSLLRLCLKLGLRMAQRYNVARYKAAHPSAQAALLAKHYNFNLDNLHKIAMPFPKPSSTAASFSQTPGKGKEKASQAASFNTSDLVAIAKTPISMSAKQDMSAVTLSYYEQPMAVSRTDGAAEEPAHESPATPTPARRTSNLGPSRDRPSPVERSISADDVSATPVKSRELDNSPSTAPKSFHISAAKVSDSPTWSLVAEALPSLPTELRYELLNRVRIAKAFATSESTNQELLEVRLLAIANLAFVLNESKFQEKVGIPDAEEPRRFHLAQQLCDLLQPAAGEQIALTLQMETTVVLALEALTKSRHKVTEVADALAITVNHGALYYELRKVIAAINMDDSPDKKIESEESERRDAMFDLVTNLLGANAQARYAEKMVNAGIMGILVEVLGMRTARAERCYERVLQFFDSFIHGIPDSFQTLSNVNGLNIIADLTAHEVDAALEKFNNGQGLPAEYKSSVNDYDIPFYHQCTLRQLFKNTVHMFEHNAGTYDRLLRNLIDTPQILGALRKVIERAPIFGSNVWSGALNIITSFIHNEPTCYQVIGEAGLTKAFFEAITEQKLPEELPPTNDFTPLTESRKFETTANGEPAYPSIAGILPVAEVMADVPNAFGAFCLNESGMQIFQASGALVKYFDVFLSPTHIQAIEDDDHAAMIGQQFDELSRHHPALQDHILAAVFNMLSRLKELCVILAAQRRSGAKLWEVREDETVVSGGTIALRGPSTADYNGAFEGVTAYTPASGSERMEEDERECAPAIPYLSACFKFLEGFFHNNSMTARFCEAAGIELILDLAMSPSNPHDLIAFPLFGKISQVIKLMADAKAHLVLPSIVKRTHTSMLGLKELISSVRTSSSFATYTNFSDYPVDSPVADGTTIVKSLLHAQLLSHLLGRTLAPPPYSMRHANPHNQLFSSLNLTDLYIQLIEDLSKLHATCLWENLLLLRSLSDKTKASTEPRAYVQRRVDKSGLVKVAHDKSHGGVKQDEFESERPEGESRKERLALKNLKTLRYLLNQVPKGVESFFHSLGQAIVPKRIDPAVKQHSMHVAECLAKALLWELDFRRNDELNDATETRYVSHMLTCISQILLRNSYAMETLGTKEALTLLLTKFYAADGFAKLNGYLLRFADAVTSQDLDKVQPQARDAVHTILTFYGNVVRHKCIIEAPQSSNIQMRDRTQPDYFQPGQFLVEIREAVLPAISEIWHSKDIDKFSDVNTKSIVDILRHILKAEGEDRALMRRDNASRRVLARTPQFKLTNTTGLDSLKAKGYGTTLSREALYRCNNHESNAEAYCKLRQNDVHVARLPIPEGEPAAGDDDDTPPSADAAVDAHMSSEAAAADETDSVDMDDPHRNAPTLTLDADGNPRLVIPSDSDMMSDDDNLGTLGAIPADMRTQDLRDIADQRTLDVLGAFRPGIPGTDTQQLFKTVDDLNDGRETLRGDLVDRCLDVLSAQPTITFELADLIQAAVAKAGEGANPRAEIGSTLVSSLMSLKQSEEPTSKELGAKIQAYAHLVALILQDRDFFDSTLDDLKEYFGDLVEWVQLEPDQKTEDAPWIRTVLLVIERVLAEDEQPVAVEWTPPSPDNPLKPLPVPEAPEPVVSKELRSRLFDALIGILPKVGKNPSLALSICRVLVVLTRRRDLATRLSEKYTLGRLFLMIRQLAGSVDEKLQGSFMLILRHMVEDDAVVRQIMRSEIKAMFENHRSSRAMDTTIYIRNLHHLVLRNPSIFVEVTQELLEIASFDGNPNRAQALTLKKSTEAPTEKKANLDVDASAPAAEDSVEADNIPEAKPLSVEATDGVVQFLLRELSNFKDVEDKPVQAPKDDQPERAAMDDFSPDVEMPDAVAPAAAVPPTGTATPAATAEAKANGKSTFKPEEHVIYIYRCFVLQCLAELLACYNRTKVEFINFSRKSDPQPLTPSKPRAGTLNYLLSTLLPPGTLEHRDDVAHRKKIATSSWATQVLVSLCTKTQENYLGHGPATNSSNFSEKEPELTFVRKFVLEHSLRAFKEATTSAEPLDQRYSRLLVLGELFNKMLNGKAEIQRQGVVPSGHYPSHQHMGRLMYEKNFIGTLTSAIAELDLNFPNAKRTVKYILGPLKQLTDLGVELSQTLDITIPGESGALAEEDDISSAATSVSEDDDEREQTPDLFRGSSLGMFETGTGEDDDDSDDDDDDEEGEDEMYGDGYDDEMDYEEEPAPDHGEVVSDEDEDLHGMGEIEGVPGDVDMEVDMIMGDDDDEDSEDTSGDDEEDDDDDDDDNPDDDIEFEEHMDEITGDDDNASMDEHDHEGDWEDETALLDEHFLNNDGGSPHGGPLEHIAHVLGADDPSEAGDDGIVRIDMDAAEDEFFEDEMAPEVDEDEDGEEYGADIVYEPEMEDDDDEDQDDGWNAWEAQPPPAAVLRGHHHHHHHHYPPAFEQMLGGMIGGDPMRAGHFRTHRPPPNAGDEPGINPLLQRQGGPGNTNRDRELAALGGPRLAGRQAYMARNGEEFLQHLVASVPPRGGPAGGVINVTAGLPGLEALPSMLTIEGRPPPGTAWLELDHSRPLREQLSMGRWGEMLNGRVAAMRPPPGNEEASAVDFRPSQTSTRWQEEARMLFGSKHQDKATRVLNMLFRALLPQAMEAKRLREKAEAERKVAQEKAAEEARKIAEAEKAEREAQEKKERAEREALERAESEALAAELAAQAGTESTSAAADTDMAGVLSVSESGPADAPAPEQPPAETIMISIGGREMDISSLGIDREYIEALPEDMREEVILTQFATQRSQAAASGETPSEISREFLDALPREIQQELLRQEQSERRRARAENQRRAAVQDGGAAAVAAPQPEEMNNADFMAMLDPALRQAVLMDTDEDTLAMLPDDLQAEARALFGNRPRRSEHAGRLARGMEDPTARVLADPTRDSEENGEASRQRRPIAQMLDKAGIATLLRLMFVQLNSKPKMNLNGILSDVCKNTQNRSEVISILLSILQDGTADVNAVERSFAQLSLRAKQPSGPKTPQTLKRTLTGQQNVTTSTELSPLNIVQQCLGTLNALSNDNPRVPSFFLNEHETVVSQKAKIAKKGKGRESRAAKFPLNALLTLLDRKLITENTAVMETLASLLSHVTRPLTILLRRAREAQDADKTDTDKATDIAARPQTGSSDVPMQDSASTEQPGDGGASAASVSAGASTGEENTAVVPDAKKKKSRDLTPPEVPEENIRLVVNILAARECPSRTFSDTLDIIKNLSAIPGAKEVFGRELIRQAQDLGQALLEDLDGLAKQIKLAETGTELQGMALASFSSAGSKQRKLLRVLVALDHLFDPKRTPAASATTATPSSGEQKLKEDILASLYDSSKFDKLWDSLSVCLTAIRERGNMVNVATILLPLIESLMVVCRNSTLKQPQAALTAPADTVVSSPPPDSRIGGLFFTFTDEHRKILNELIRNNPKLMNGNLAVLAKNSKVLEFDNKRNYFARKLHVRSEVRAAHPSLQLSVRRAEVFLDSFKSLYYKSGNEIKYGKLNIRFHGEEGVDAGGVSREWFAAMARQMFNPNYALFTPVASDRTTFHPNTMSEINPEHLLFFKFVGRVIGKALYENRVLDCHFSRAVYRRILGKSVSLKDMETLDLDYYKSLVWILENDITDVTFETFSVDVDKFGVTETIDLIPNGRNIGVTEENKHEYVRHVVDYRLVTSVKDQLDSFLQGFHEIIPIELVSIFNEQELELLISGLPDIDVDDWKNNTEYTNYQPTSPQIMWFWRAVKSFDKEEKAKLLQFITGTSKVPLNGFKELEGMNGFSKFSIHRDYGNKERLPSSHTCFNQLDLPEYESYENLRHQLYTAITAGSEYFGFA